MDGFLSPLLYSFSALFIILDPLLSIPIFSDMTRGQPDREVTHQAWIAVGRRRRGVSTMVTHSLVKRDLPSIAMNVPRRFGVSAQPGPCARLYGDRAGQAGDREFLFDEATAKLSPSRSLQGRR